MYGILDKKDSTSTVAERNPFVFVCFSGWHTWSSQGFLLAPDSGITPRAAQGAIRGAGMEPRWTTCKAVAVPIVPSLWPPEGNPLYALSHSMGGAQNIYLNILWFDFQFLGCSLPPLCSGILSVLGLLQKPIEMRMGWGVRQYQAHKFSKQRAFSVTPASSSPGSQCDDGMRWWQQWKLCKLPT